MTIPQYIDNLQSRFKSGIATEHTYRGYLQSLLESIATGVTVTNEPARIKCGAPDYILTRKEIPVGYLEAKDIGKDINHKDYKEQFDRYRKSLNNLIITDYLEFQLFIDSEFKTSYPQDGNNVVTTPRFEARKVYINPTQYFEGVPESTWQFYIGGYQPAQKWLKDRKGRELSFDDIFHYQRMKVALSETERLMEEIDQIKFE